MSCRRVEDAQHMQRKARFYRVQLLAYDLVDAPLWSLPLIGPSPTPMPLDEPSFYITRPRLQTGVASLYPGRLLHKIHLLPIGDGFSQNQESNL